jgi:zinc transporter 1/2/3
MVYAHIARDLAVQALHIVARHGSHGSFEDYEAEHDHEEGHDHEVGVDHDHVAELLAAFCRGEGARGDSHTNLRIAAIFIILAGSTLGALFPIVARKVRRLAVRPAIFE